MTTVKTGRELGELGGLGAIQGMWGSVGGRSLPPSSLSVGRGLCTTSIWTCKLHFTFLKLVVTTGKSSLLCAFQDDVT